MPSAISSGMRRSVGIPSADQRREMLRAKISTAETGLTRHRVAIEAGMAFLAVVHCDAVWLLRIS